MIRTTKYSYVDWKQLSKPLLIISYCILLIISWNNIFVTSHCLENSAVLTTNHKSFSRLQQLNTFTVRTTIKPGKKFFIRILHQETCLFKFLQDTNSAIDFILSSIVRCPFVVTLTLERNFVLSSEFLQSIAATVSCRYFLLNLSNIGWAAPQLLINRKTNKSLRKIKNYLKQQIQKSLLWSEGKYFFGIILISL